MFAQSAGTLWTPSVMNASLQRCMREKDKIIGSMDPVRKYTCVISQSSASYGLDVPVVPPSSQPEPYSFFSFFFQCKTQQKAGQAADDADRPPHLFLY